MKLRYAAVLVPWALLAFCHTVCAREAKEVAPLRLLAATVDVDAQGVITQVQWPADVGDDVRAPLTAAVQKLTVQPAQSEGRPVAARTSVRVGLHLDPQPDGNSNVRAEYLGHGPGFENRLAPSYPKAQLRKRVGAEVWIDVAVDAEGKLLEAGIADAVVTSDKTVDRAAFEAAALDAVRQWRFQPEMLAGVPVPGRVRIPVRFIVDQNHDEKLAERINAHPELADHRPQYTQTLGNATGLMFH